MPVASFAGRLIGRLLIVLLFVALPMVMLYTLWGEPLSAGEDDVVCFFPLRKMVGDELRAGSLPLYNTREATGVPLMADPQSAVMHPTTWLFAILDDAKLAYSLSLFAAFSLAGGGAYLYLRRIGLIRVAAILGGVAFMFCGFLVGHRVHLGLITAAAMLPWGLWCIEGLRRLGGSSRDADSQPAQSVGIDGVSSPHDENSGDRAVRAGSRLGAALWFVPVIYLIISAGHWPTLIHVGLLWALYMLFRARPLVSSVVLACGAAVLAAAICAPQLGVTMELLSQATRQKIEYGVAGENSFLPTSGVLMLYPFFMGSRHPNLFSQNWWGSWHLCEMLGYVGLVTLVIAMATVWRLFRKRRRGWRRLEEQQKKHAGKMPAVQEACQDAGKMPAVQGACQDAGKMPAVQGAYRHPLTALVRTWVWILVGCAVFMMGYYLPTYHLWHMVPVLGVVRCPARMMVAIDLGLATLAAVGLHVMLTNGDERSCRLRKTVRTVAIVVLPGLMLLALGFFYGAGRLLKKIDMGQMPAPFNGTSHDVLDAARGDNPAVYIQWILLAATATLLVLLVRAIRKSPPDANQPAHAAPTGEPDDASLVAERGALLRPKPGGAGPKAMLLAGALVVMLLADLFFITRFVDVPERAELTPDPTTSRTAEELRKLDPDTTSYRIWGLSRNYSVRPDELLLPKTCETLGVRTIANYGPFQSPHHAHLFGFRPWGYTRDWESLLRRNSLLSLYSVKYIIAADPEFRRVLDSVQIQAPPPAGENMLTDNWDIDEGSMAWWNALRDAAGIRREGPPKGTLRMETLLSPYCRWKASQPIRIEPDTVYRIALDARSEDGGPTYHMQAQVAQVDGARVIEFDRQSLIIEAEMVSGAWRHFEWTFRSPPARQAGGHKGTEYLFRVYSLGERAIEVRNISLTRSGLDQPVNLANKLQPGQHVYRKLMELEPRTKGQPPVAIYENLLAEPIAGQRSATATEESLEAVKWSNDAQTLPRLLRLDISMAQVRSPMSLLWVSAAGLGAYALLIVLALLLRRARGNLAGRALVSSGKKRSTR